MPQLEDYAFRHDGVIYKLSIDAQEWPFESAKQGRKVFKDVEVMSALVPGSKNQENSYLVNPDLIETKGIREHYEKWKSGAKSVVGTPLTELDDLTQGQIKTLQASNILSVEGLAELDDNLLSILGPMGRAIRDKARIKIGFSSDEGVKALKAENESMKTQMAALAAQIQAMQAAAAAPAPAEAEAASKPKGKKARDVQDPFGTESAA